MDKPIKEWTLLEKLAFVASVPVPDDADIKLARGMVQDALDEIRRLRDVEVRLTARVAVLEIGVNEAMTALSSKMAKGGVALPETAESTRNGGAA